jgi:hypothetical protein
MPDGKIKVAHEHDTNYFRIVLCCLGNVSLVLRL